MQWSREQDRALRAVADWHRDRDPSPFRLFGYAGTGKTELAREIGRNLPSVRFAALTGKAASKMAERGCKPCSTIHSLIYTARFDERSKCWRYSLKPRDQLNDTKLLIVDEASMINEQLATDLLSFGIRLLVIGDPGQLPPVNGNGHFMTDRPPDAMLTEVHRQAAASPILQLANDIRRGKPLPRAPYRAGDAVEIVRRIGQADPASFDILLTGRRSTRRTLNAAMRRRFGYVDRHSTREPPPYPGEQVVCQRNDYGAKVFNGSTWGVETVQPELVRVDGDELPVVSLALINSYEGTTVVSVPVKCFLDLKDYHPPRGLQEFTFGYALTVHRAQGSEWDSVLLVNESRCFRRDARRWLYTGCTRAKNKLTIIDNN